MQYEIAVSRDHVRASLVDRQTAEEMRAFLAAVAERSGERAAILIDVRASKPVFQVHPGLLDLLARIAGVPGRRVALQPVYMHPYSVAKMVTSLAFLHGRRVDLNLVAGGFKNDLAALGDTTPHDDRYLRLEEYAGIVQRLLAGEAPVTHDGKYYQVANLRLTPPLLPGLMPEMLISGSSEAGVATARRLRATAIEYPKPAHEYAGTPASDLAARGVRIGVVARDDDALAWQAAEARFPEDRKGQLTRELATKVSDSAWHHDLAERRDAAPGSRDPYWLVPFKNYKAMCPYLVGSYDRVGEELGRYVDLGYRSFILDVPPSAEEMQHVGAAFSRASARLALA